MSAQQRIREAGGGTFWKAWTTHATRDQGGSATHLMDSADAAESVCGRDVGLAEQSDAVTVRTADDLTAHTDCGNCRRVVLARLHNLPPSSSTPAEDSET